MINVSLRFAIFLSIALGISNIAINEFMLAESDWGVNLSNMFSFACMIVVLFFGMKTARNVVYNGEATYGQVFYSGFIITLMTAIGAGIFTIIYFQFVRPDFVVLYAPIIEKNLLELKTPAAEIKNHVEEFKSGFSVSTAFFNIIFFVVLINLIFSAVLASFIRTKDTFTAEGPGQNLGK